MWFGSDLTLQLENLEPISKKAWIHCWPASEMLNQAWSIWIFRSKLLWGVKLLLKSMYKKSLVLVCKHGVTADARENNVVSSKQRCMSFRVCLGWQLIILVKGCKGRSGKWKGASFVGKNREGKRMMAGCYSWTVTSKTVVIC